MLDAYALRALTDERPQVLPASIPTAFGLALFTLAIVGLVRHRLAGALVAVATLLCSAGAAWFLKSALPRPRLSALSMATGNSFPSGHVVLVTSFVLALLLVVPTRFRWLVAGFGAIAACLVVSGTLAIVAVVVLATLRMRSMDLAPRTAFTPTSVPVLVSSQGDRP